MQLIASPPSSPTTTIAGTGVPGFSGDGGPATQAQINNPYGLTIGPDGALYFCEIGNHRIRRLDLQTHILTTAVTDPSLKEPYEVRFDRAGNLFFADMPSHVVRRVDAKTHVITTVAGTGIAGFSGDGGPAIKAQLRQPHSIAFDADGRLLICDIGNHRIRRVDLATGVIETWAGTGEKKPTPDGAPSPEPRSTVRARSPPTRKATSISSSAKATPSTASTAATVASTTSPEPARLAIPAMAATRNWPASPVPRPSPGPPTTVSTSPTPRATPSAASI